MLHGCQRPGAGCLEAVRPPPWDVALGAWGRAGSWAPRALPTPARPVAFLSDQSVQHLISVQLKASF